MADAIEGTLISLKVMRGNPPPGVLNIPGINFDPNSGIPLNIQGPNGVLYPLGAGGGGGGPSGGTGTVETVSVVTANGVSGTVANPTVAPAITIQLNNITPTSVTAAGNVTGANLSGTNTGDQSSISGNAGTATKLQVARNIDGQAFDGTVDITVIAPGTHAASAKTTPADNDELPLVDSAASFLLRRFTWLAIKNALKAYFDPLYASAPTAGTVKSVAVTTANGVSGSVTNPTSTPAISLTLGAITPASVVSTGNIFGANLSGTNTGDQSTVSGNAGTATALQTSRNIDGQPFNGTADITVIAPGTHAATAKTTPVDADELALIDSAAAFVLKRLTLGNVKAWLKTYFDTLYTAVGGTGTVTTVSVASANGISGTVATPSTTPAITLTLGAITPTTVTASGVVTGSNLAGVNTGDQTSIIGNAGSSTKLATARNIDGQPFDGTADITVIAPGTNAATSKTTPVDADKLPLVDSAAGSVLKHLTWANVKATAKTYFDTLYTKVGAITGSGVTMSTARLVGRTTAGTGAPEEITVGSGLLLSAGTLTATASGGSVTSVSVTTANGVSGSVTNPTTTPAIALTLGAITPASVAAVGTVTGSNLSGTNTGDQSSVTGNAGTATALQTARNIDGQPFDGTASITVIAPGTHAATSKTVPVDADELPLADSASTFTLKRLTWTNLKATLKIYLDTLYVAAGAITGSGLTMGTNRLLGRSTAGTGAAEEISLGTGLTLTAGTLSAAGLGGTVTTVSVVTANGVSGTVANPTSTPAITVALGAITPTSVAATGNVTGGNLSGVNTGDQVNVTGNAGTATKLATARNIDGQAFDGTANITVIAPGTHAAPSKTTPVDADELALVDSAASNILKRLTWANAKATLKTYMDTLYAAAGLITGSGLTMGTAKMLGRTTAGTGAAEEITIGAGLSLTAGTLSATGGGGTSSNPSYSTQFGRDMSFNGGEGFPVSATGLVRPMPVGLYRIRRLTAGGTIALYDSTTGTDNVIFPAGDVSLLQPSEIGKALKYGLWAVVTGGTYEVICTN